MPTVKTYPGNASTFLTHLIGQGLDDDRYRVECFRSMADGDIRPLRAGGRSATSRQFPNVGVRRSHNFIR